MKALGHSSVVIGGFADQDTVSVAEVYKKVAHAAYGLNEKEVLQTAYALMAECSFDGLFYGAAIEFNPSLLNQLDIAPIFGNSAHTLDRCKNPSEFFFALDRNSIPYPETSFSSVKNNTDNWLVKENHSSGGIGIRPYKLEMDALTNAYLQKKITGTNFSITFLANGKDISTLGFNTLWSESLGELMPYAYAGAINSTGLGNEILSTAERYAKIIAREFDLVGLNSIDFICDEDSIYVLEVNARIPATYELYETKTADLMREHIEVCRSRTLPTEKRPNLLRAHATVYAYEDIQIPENMSWPLWTADRPHDGELIPKYTPICSVFAGAKNSAQVDEMIKTRKRSIILKLAH